MSPTIEAPQAPAALPPVAQAESTSTNPTGGKPKRKSAQPTFLGADASPDATQVGQKTLIGQ